MPHPTLSQQRARSGAALLDSRLEGWRNVVRIGGPLTSVACPSDCVLARLFGSYTSGANALGLIDANRASAYGFEPGWDNDADAETTAEWNRILFPENA